jgi:hypothetical protein
MRTLWGTHELQPGKGLLVRGIAARADAGFKNWGNGRMLVPELSRGTTAGVSKARKER